MEYMINHPNYSGKFTREEVQTLINEKKISLNTKIWNKEWYEWRNIRDTDFDLTKAKYEAKSDLPENFFLSIHSFLSHIDNGNLFRKPFSVLYGFIAFVNLIPPIYLIFEAAENEIFNLEGKIPFLFCVIWIILSYASWFSFQIWWDRKSKVYSTSSEGDDFIAIPVFSHFIQTLGEWIGSWLVIVGFLISLTTILFFSKEMKILSSLADIPIIENQIIFLITVPIIGFLIIVITRFIAEQSRALASIANNIRKH
jgi:hypothetical protein